MYIYKILSRINSTTMNLLLKVSRFFHDLFTTLFTTVYYCLLLSVYYLLKV